MRCPPISQRPRVDKERGAQRAMAALALLLLPCPAASQDLPTAPPDPARPTAEAVRTDTAPVIDGVLDDAVWRLASPIGPLTQVEPVVGAAPSQRTEIRVLFDDDHLFVGVRCFDDDPAALITTTSERDARLNPDDRFELVIDTYLDRRNAFFFQMNPAGSKGDGLITDNGRDFNKPWDGIWDGVTSIDAEGWSAELALPFKTLNFDPDTTTWGFNLQRFIRRHNEEARWAGPSRNYGLFQVAEAGDLTGIEGIQQGLGLDVVPVITGRWFKDRSGPSHREVRRGDPGLDVFYNITPDLKASLTLNTDFAEAEVDERRVNLTRFPLFFPERRDFFLEDAGQFEFADLGNDLIPFFSRRIGSVNGEQVPLRVGAKVTGRQGPWNIGLLDARTGSSTGLDAQNLFTARITRNVGEESTVGGIITRGDPEGESRNALVGLDANYRSTSFLGGNRLQASAFFLQSDSPGLADAEQGGDESAYGVRVRYPNDVWSWGVDAKEIQDDFQADLGFVPRRGIRSYRADVSWRPRIDTEELRRWEFQVEGDIITDTDGETESSNVEIQPFSLQWQNGDRVGLEVESVREVLISPFDITSDVTIPPGDYSWTRTRLEYDQDDGRVLALGGNVETGDFYDGRRVDWAGRLDWRPGATFNGGLEYERNRVSLDDGRFTTQITRLRANVFFSPDLSWNTFWQWDSVSDVVGVNSRLRWIPDPGQEIFFVFNRAWQRDRHHADPLFAEFVVKGQYTVRF